MDWREANRAIIIALWAICGVLWMVAVYSDFPNILRVPAVLLMVGLSFLAGSRNR